MRPTPWLPLLGLALSLCACKSSEKVGELPEEMMRYLSYGTPGGTLELEVDDDGRIVEMEVDVPIEMLPSRVLVGARQRLPYGVITGAERELVGDDEAWEVKMWYQGTDYEFIFTRKGRLVESEQSIGRYDCPEVVREAANLAVPGGLTKSYEIVRRKGVMNYHIKRLRDGATYKIVISPEGLVLRNVREAKAEIEVTTR